ncbi:MAG: hypothetical protein ABEH77_11025 [Halobacteriaceae archaeon]
MRLYVYQEYGLALMGMARNALLGVEVLGYLVVIAGVLLNYSGEQLATSPPVVPVAVATVGLIAVATLTAYVAP